MQKLTIANKFDEVVNFITGNGQVSMSQDEIVEFLLDRRAKSIKKAGTRKPTATQKENEVLKDVILEKMPSEPSTITDLIHSIEELNGFNTQKVSALVRQLVLAGKVKKEKEGKKTLFSLADW